MDIKDSLLFPEIDYVLKGRPTRTNYGWKAKFHCNDIKGNGDGSKSEFQGMKVLGLTINRNYVKNFADEITCQILVPLGKYAKKIYPSRNDLEITLSKRRTAERSAYTGGSSNSRYEDVDRYTAIILNKEKSPNVAQGQESMSEEAMDHSGVVQLNVQLIPKSIEKIRTIQVGGVYSKTKVDELMNSVIVATTKDISTDQNGKLKSVDIFPVTNKEVKGQVVVPHGTLLIDFPGFLQKRVGVYNSGLGSYIQNKNWFVYPLYDTKNIAERKEIVTIIVLPPKKFPHIERTYRKQNGAVTIIVTGETHYSDSNNADSVSKGTGARFTDANKMITEPNKTKDNKTKVSRSKMTNEFTTNKNEKVTNAPMTGNKITANPYPQYSTMMSRTGGYFKFHWQSCAPDVVKPGSFARILYEENKEVKELYGILHYCQYMSVPLGGIVGESYSNNAILSFFSNEKKKEDSKSSKSKKK